MSGFYIKEIETSSLIEYTLNISELSGMHYGCYLWCNEQPIQSCFPSSFCFDLLLLLFKNHEAI